MVVVVVVLAVVVVVVAHCPSVLQISPSGQVPQVPPRPQPSGPHALPAQFGTQHRSARLHVVALAAQQTPLQQRVAQSEFGVTPSTTDV